MATSLADAADAFYAAGNRMLAGDPSGFEAITTDIRATTIFRREAGQWRVVHHHTDRFSPGP
ncbi:nuclear transport factor 2 family protein [Cyanobium sp. FGCU-6]|nr:nuclear transport factor 2 family protein [Cyanobium sp. FGCU6]